MTSPDLDIMSVAIRGLSAEDTNPRFIEDLQDRVDIIVHKLKFIEKKPTVVCLSSLVPFTAADNWVPDLIKLVGGLPVLDSPAENVSIDWVDIRLADPEILVIALKGFAIEQTMREIGMLLDQQGFNELSAVKSNRLYVADGSQYFYQTGERVIDSLEILAEIINPKQFIFGYEGQGWVKFDM